MVTSSGIDGGGMGNDVARDLNRVQSYTTGLQAFIHRLESLIPHRVEGSDSTGILQTVIGTDGLPISFVVHPDWKRYLRPASFGSAVVEAFQAATNRRLQAWATAMNDGDPPALGDHTGEGTVGPPRTPEREAPSRASRDAVQNIQEILDAMGDMGRLMETTPTSGSGSTGFGKLTLTMTDGQLICTADQFWVADRTGEELTEALSTALAAAREDLAKAVASSPMGRLERLAAEATAALHGVGGLAGSRADRKDSHDAPNQL
jgi:hypothetical protein